MQDIMSDNIYASKAILSVVGDYSFLAMYIDILH